MWEVRDRAGDIHGRLTVIRLAFFDRRRQAYWLCECTCGEEKEIRGSSLDGKHGTKSCGCLARELAAARLKGVTGRDSIGFRHRGREVRILKGRRFGKWFVITRAPNGVRNHTRWLCECSCEKRTRRVVDGSSLIEGASTSCCGSRRWSRRAA
jgi:hypothetical protein